MTTDTGWSKETVNCEFLLLDPKICKSAITQWFLGSLYSAVSVFWCFKTVMWWDFVFGSFSNKEHLLHHHTRPEHSYTYTLRRIQTSQAYIHTLHCYTLRYLLQLSRDNTGQQQILTETKNVVWGYVAVHVDIKWCLLISFGFSCCLEMWGGCLRSFSKGIWVLFPVVDS